MQPSPQARKPRHLDIIISNGSHTATGPFDVILFDKDSVRAYPLLFLKETDTDFSELKASISGVTLNPDKTITPVGTLKLIWKKDI